MRWLKFNAVGALGMAVQLGSLGVFVHVLGLHYLLATALAVEAAVLHNFVWHRRWTWADRQAAQSVPTIAIFLRFNLTTGLASIAGNVLFMWILARCADLEPVIANGMAIALCSVVNFVLSDRWTFALPCSGKAPGRETVRRSISCSGESHQQAGVKANT